MEKSELESFAVNLKTVENELGTFSLGKVLGHGGASVVKDATFVPTTLVMALLKNNQQYDKDNQQ